MRRATCTLAIRLKSVRVTHGAMLLSDVEATADATTALGDLRVDTMVWCSVARTFGILFRVAAASQEPMMSLNVDEDVLVVVEILCQVTEVVDPRESVMVNFIYDAQNIFRYLSFTWTLKLQAVLTSSNTRLVSLNCCTIGQLSSNLTRRETIIEFSGTC